MRNVDLKEIGNPESAVYSKLLKHTQSHSKPLRDELCKLLNTSNIELSCSIKDQFERKTRSMVFESDNLLFTLYLSDIDLNCATLLHLGATPSQDTGTEIRFTNSHAHILRRIGTAIGFFLFDVETKPTSLETEKSTQAIELVINISSDVTITTTIELDALSSNKLFDQEIAKRATEGAQIPKAVFRNIELELTASIGETKLPIHQTSQIRVGTFVPMNDLRNKAEIRANGKKIGTGQYIEHEKNSKGIKIL